MLYHGFSSVTYTACPPTLMQSLVHQVHSNLFGTEKLIASCGAVRARAL
jgi:hypothetical protein